MRRIELDPPPEIAAAVGAVHRADGRALLVGGGVRDRLLGLPSDDWDLASDLRPATLRAVLPNVLDVDEALGRVAIQGPPGCPAVVWTTFRAERDYDEHRRPRHVEFVDTPEQDAQRRDFTINAIYVDTRDGSIVDPFGGVAHLRDRELHCVGDPDVRFGEDPLRALRAVRFAARYGLCIGTATERALAQVDVRGLSGDRFRDDCEAAWTGPASESALRMHARFGLLEHHLGERTPRGESLERAGRILAAATGSPTAAASPCAAATAWAAVLGAGDPAIAPDWRGGVERVARKLSFARRLRRDVSVLFETRDGFAAALDAPPEGRAAWLRHSRFDVLCHFHRARIAADGASTAALERLVAARRELPDRPLLDGRDALALGVPAGPLVGEVLQRARDAAAAAAVDDRAAALELLRQIVREVVKNPRAPRR